MFRGKDIEGLVRIFKKKQAPLFHACQLSDFNSYLQLGGIPSRACMEESSLCYTEFDTDAKDKAKGVWDKVFVNLQDFGEIFAKGKKGIPNPYGPISLQISPDALRETTEVSITLRSAGSDDFDREKESLTKLEEVERLFFTYGSNRYLVRFGKNLKDEFGNHQAKSVEINCAVPSGRLSFGYVEEVLVDPYTAVNLQDWVINEASSHIRDFVKLSKHKGIDYRSTWQERKPLYDELAKFIMSEKDLSLTNLLKAHISPSMKMWAESIKGCEPEYQFNQRYVEYLRQGTLNYIYGK